MYEFFTLYKMLKYPLYIINHLRCIYLKSSNFHNICLGFNFILTCSRELCGNRYIQIRAEHSEVQVCIKI